MFMSKYADTLFVKLYQLRNIIIIINNVKFDPYIIYKLIINFASLNSMLRSFILSIILTFALSRRFCIFEKKTSVSEDKQKPYIVKASQSIKILSDSEFQLMKDKGPFYHYKPHYLHSYSYPQPLTPHLFYGQVNNAKQPVFLVKENQTFKGQNIAQDIFYINDEKEEEYNVNILEAGKLDLKNFKFIVVLQIQNMFEKPIDTSISVYRMKNYFAIIADLGVDFKAFTLSFLDSEKYLVDLKNLVQGLKIRIRNQNKFGNRQSWRNVQVIKWLETQPLSFPSNANQPLKFDTFVMEIEYVSTAVARRVKLHFKQFPKNNQNQHIESVIKRITNIEPSSLINVIQHKTQKITCAAQAQRLLVRGLSYEYGTLVLKNGSQTLPNQPKQLLSFSPSRKRFPWGFLWDDGFHCEVACRNNQQITLKVIKSWLDTMTETGWIPREQNRGKERQFLCSCPQFMAKDVRDGNPPTLLLSLHYLAKKKYLNKSNFQEHYWERLKSWYNWFLQTQQTSKNSFIFRWHDSISGEGSFNSGMDDFPRMRNTQGHVDCQSWVYFFSKAMIDISNALGKQAIEYVKNSDQIKLMLLQNFLDPSSHLLKDFLIDRNSKKVFNENFGYPSILPLAFGMIDQQSQEFNETLNAIKYLLDSGYGLTSISMKSRYYLQNNNAYWRGPVWININYLLLKGLFEHYPSTKKYYQKLRKELISTVCGEWENNNYFYENYIKGKGSFSYPFTGWTTLISIIVNENY